MTSSSYASRIGTGAAGAAAGVDVAAGAAPGRRTLVEQAYSAEAGVGARQADVAPALPRLQLGGVAQAKRSEGGGSTEAAERAPAAAEPAMGGKPLPSGIRQKMEHSLGADFSSVRIHEGGAAGALGALAFTQGNDIHFAPGQYDPESVPGQQLLGHELAHVVQQREGRVAAPAQGKDAPINEDAALEAEADAKGERAALGLATDAPEPEAEEFDYDEDDDHPEDDTDPEVEGEGGGGEGGGASAEASPSSSADATAGRASTSGGDSSAAVGRGVLQPFRGRALAPIQFGKHKFDSKKKKRYQIYEVVERKTGHTVYRGQTLRSVGIKKRFKQHCRQKQWKAKHYRIREIDSGMWTAFEACCFEQWYIEKQGMSYLTFNRINAITRKKFMMYRKLHNDLPYKWKPSN